MTSATTPNNTKPISVFHRKIPALAGVNHYQHPLTQAIFVKSGLLSVVNQHGRYFVPANQVIIIPEQTLHELLAKTAVELTIFYFDQQQASSLPTHTQIVSAGKTLQALLSETTSINNEEAWQGRHGRLLRLLRDYLSEAPPLDIFLPYPQDSRLVSITDKLLKHPSLKSDLISWGKFVNASSRTLTRLFKKETGITYSEWRQRLNIQIAVKHLVSGDSVSNIATLLGYESSSAFIYMFKKQMGISPNQFLKQTISG